jgi:hypothetical protein
VEVFGKVGKFFVKKSMGISRKNFYRKLLLKNVLNKHLFEKFAQKFLLKKVSKKY